VAIASYGGRPSLWFRLSSSGRYVIAPNSMLVLASRPFLRPARCYSPVIGKLGYWSIPSAVLSSTELTLILYLPYPAHFQEYETRGRWR